VAIACEFRLSAYLSDVKARQRDLHCQHGRNNAAKLLTIAHIRCPAF
jgi:hypothetical protein